MSLNRKLVLLLFLLTTAGKISANTISIKVHFLYGSKPKAKYKEVEPKWFGGLHGGHVGIETDSNKIIDFIPYGDFHYVAHRSDINSKFAVRTLSDFWELFGVSADSVKKLTVEIPVSLNQKQKLDSIAEIYTRYSPYDYAFIGMRCGSAAYDLLSQIGILKKYSYRKTYLKIFYPKKLRRILINLAAGNNWTITRQEGTERRKWEED